MPGALGQPLVLRACGAEVHDPRQATIAEPRNEILMEVARRLSLPRLKRRLTS